MMEPKELKVRQFLERDAEDLYSYLSNPGVYQYEPGEPISLERAREMARERAHSTEFWAVELQAEARVVGHVSFVRQEPFELYTWEIGFIFNPTYQRRGYATESAKAVLDHGFREEKAHRVIAHCNPENVASWRVLEKAGLAREGHLRKNVFFRKDQDGNPVWIDTFEYAILDSDYWGQTAHRQD